MSIDHNIDLQYQICKLQSKAVCLAPLISCSMAAMLRDVVVFRRAHGPAIHAASHVKQEKRVALFSISMHACQFCSYSLGAPLGGP